MSSSDSSENDSGSNIIIPFKKLRVISDVDDDEVTASILDDDIINEFLSVDTIFSIESNTFSVLFPLHIVKIACLSLTYISSLLWPKRFFDWH